MTNRIDQCSSEIELRAGVPWTSMACECAGDHVLISSTSQNISILNCARLCVIELSLESSYESFVCSCVQY